MKEGLPLLVGAIAGPEGVLLFGLVGAALPVPFAMAQEKLSQIIGWSIGTPLGFSYKWARGSTYGAKLNDALNDLFSPTPTP